MTAQNMGITSFELSPSDLTANLEGTRVLDQNGSPCALLRVQTTEKGFSFDVGSLGVQRVDEGHVGEVWVYVPAGVRRMTIRHQQLGSLSDYVFPLSIEAARTYRMELSTATVKTIIQQNDGMTYYSLLVTPKNAVVAIDGELRALDAEGGLMLRLSRGQHSYSIQAPGYATKTGQFTLGDSKLSESIALESVLAMVSVSCATPRVGIYVNEELKGTGSWSGTLVAGNYVIEGRLDGYYPQRLNVTLAEREQKSLLLPDLVPRTGQMDVSYRPIESEVWLDGKKLGTSPDVFRDIVIGQHQVEIRKAGYGSEKRTVNIEEGQTYALTGTLKEGQSSGATETFVVGGVAFRMVSVAGGTFVMGATSEQGGDAHDYEKPSHMVTLSSFRVGATEVTQALWEAVMGSNPSHFKGSDSPVENVSWDDCQEFLRKLNSLTGRRFRLPTEAEWEYAARGGLSGRGYKYSGGNDVGAVAWYDGNSGNKTHPVGTKKANELGLYDMTGNVWEWCSDWYGSYTSSSQENPKGPSSGRSRVLRGGCWSSYAGRCRLSNRDLNSPDYRYYSYGLRLALAE